MDTSQITEIVKKVIRQQEQNETMNRTQRLQDMTLDVAMTVARGVEERARDMGVKAVVAITNRGANPVLVHCMDDSFIASYDVAMGKAYTVVALKMPTIELKSLAQPGGSLYGIQNTNSGRIVIFGGGEPLMSGGCLLGGLGVSGGTEEEDTALAAYGRQLFERLSV
ncbi:MAG: heme-binding protein [Lachnospiraceae bacterium]